MNECLVETIKSNCGVGLVMGRGGLLETIFMPDECIVKIVLSDLGLRQSTSVLESVIISIEGCKGAFPITGGNQFVAIFSDDNYRSNFLKNDPKSVSEFFETFFPCDDDKFSRNPATIVMIKQISWPARNKIILKCKNDSIKILLNKKKLLLRYGKHFWEADIIKDSEENDQVILTNIPFVIDETLVKMALAMYMKFVKEIVMPKKELLPIQNVDDYFELFSEDLKNLKLEQSLRDFCIVEQENKKDFVFRAYIEFFRSSEVEIAIETIRNYFNQKDEESLNLTKVFPIFRFYYFTPKETFINFQWTVTTIINGIREKNGAFIFHNVRENSNGVITKIECESLVSCSEIRSQLDPMLNGVQCSLPYFKRTNAKHLKMIKQIIFKNKAYSQFDERTNVLRVWAEHKVVSRIQHELDAYFHEDILFVNKSIDLKNPQYPKGLLKILVNKFGFDLIGLKLQIGSDLDLNIREHCILFTGSQETFTELQNILTAAKNFTELLVRHNQSRRKVTKKNDDKKYKADECSICQDEIKRTSCKCYVTEHCGHAFCSECIIYSIKTDCRRLTFPIKCYNENCHSLLGIKDFRNLLKTEDFKFLLEASVKFQQRKSPDEILFCSTFECPLIFKKTSEKEKFICLHCYVSTCTSCGEVFHDGECVKVISD